MTSVLVLGGTGMLGSMVVDELSRNPKVHVSATFRPSHQAPPPRRIPDVAWVPFDASELNIGSLAESGHYDWIINAIGITKPLIDDQNPQHLERAVKINTLLPHVVASYASDHGTRVLQIATDCVYSGLTGNYSEDSAHDALDVYGKTKSLGECYSPKVSHLRCSIIGPEPKDFKFLLEWFRLQPKEAQVNGYLNHQWNGITTLHFARLCSGIIASGTVLPHLQHIVPSGAVSKAQMLHEFAAAYHRADVRINETNAAKVIDRTLSTADPKLNQQLWLSAGYQNPPTVPEMIAEIAKYTYRFRGQEQN